MITSSSSHFLSFDAILLPLSSSSLPVSILFPVPRSSRRELNLHYVRCSNNYSDDDDDEWDGTTGYWERGGRLLRKDTRMKTRREPVSQCKQLEERSEWTFAFPKLEHLPEFFSLSLCVAPSLCPRFFPDAKKGRRWNWRDKSSRGWKEKESRVGRTQTCVNKQGYTETATRTVLYHILWFTFSLSLSIALQNFYRLLQTWMTLERLLVTIPLFSLLPLSPSLPSWRRWDGTHP